MSAPVNWPKAIQPLLKKYQSTKHPLEYKNPYQLLVMVVLSAQDSDRHINQIAPAFFKSFPNMTALSKATEAAIAEQISDVRNFGNKAKWLSEIAGAIKKDAAIPMELEALTALKGIGRKSANVILRESGRPAQGVIVDLHVVRVAPRLGIATGTDPKKIEKQIMDVLPQKDWDAGMAISFLGRELCRPTNPKCEICLMHTVCAFYNSQ
ncbi:endonuclease III domain-containing protein [Niabella drilacis]|uniref:Endonuclease-3 n=1 Tax=Niabella drilacis (strain DSM 25811 / CCM 8410 / CCUG 62505 / LMG 26954 / E90) TaxID=1285928 RepID=A0A1G6MYM1_NIADE|nr:DNA lyase [Niabella drilacis]SDC60297.1 endonuclease-3 [Niabella drilacis]